MAMQTRIVTNQTNGLWGDKKNSARPKWNGNVRYGLFKTTPALMEKLRKEVLGPNNQIPTTTSLRNLPFMQKLMSLEVCKINPTVKAFSVENDSWKTNTPTKPLFDQRTRVYVGSELYFTGYPYSEEITKALLQQKFDNLKKYRFFEANEGTMIRVFNINNTWYTSTNKKLDAFVSKWAAKKNTFGLQVTDAVKYLLGKNNQQSCPNTQNEQQSETLPVSDIHKNNREYLNKVWEKSLQKDKKYFFLLRPCEEEKMVCETKTNRLINIGVLDAKNNLSIDEDVKLTDVTDVTDATEPVAWVVVPRPTERFFSDLTDLVQQLDALDPFIKPGFIAIDQQKLVGCDHHTACDHTDIPDGPDGTNVCVVKILSDKYKYLSLLRNNVPSLNFRYLQLEHLRTMEFLHDPNSFEAKKANSILQDFLNLYHEIFDPNPVRSYIWSVVVNDLFEKYQQIYIKHTHLDLLPKTAYALSLIHNEYIESRFSQKTDRKRIADILACIKPTLLNQLIKENQEKERKAMLKQTKKEITTEPVPSSLL